MIRLLIADDHQMMLDGIHALLELAADVKVVAMARNGAEALQAAREHTPDVVLLDINMPVMDGLAACEAIVKEFPLVKVIAMTMHGEGRLVQAMLRKGARGYLLKNCGGEELLNAIRTVHQGGTWISKEASDKLVEDLRTPQRKGITFVEELTTRELDVLRLIATERTTGEIGRELGISENTVESHRKQLLQKLGARNSAGLVRIAMERGLL
ncbi:MAG: response regulator transcription factor [Flavobacteriales bacterium]|nr:response regulator transcription factor [Flavobacteriales bacterium]